jgi:hypothetical protein
VNHESSICTLQKKHGDLKGELWSTLCRSIGGTEARILIWNLEKCEKLTSR